MRSVGVIPSGFAGAGKVKGSSSDTFYDISLSPDNAGTYGVTSVTQTVSVGADGFAYMKAGSPGVTSDSLFASQTQSSRVSIYSLTANGDPALATRRDFVTQVNGLAGIVVDPFTNDLLLVTTTSSISRTGFNPPSSSQGSE
jgi:hypothetical protein